MERAWPKRHVRRPIGALHWATLMWAGLIAPHNILVRAQTALGMRAQFLPEWTPHIHLHRDE